MKNWLKIAIGVVVVAVACVVIKPLKNFIMGLLPIKKDSENKD